MSKEHIPYVVMPEGNPDIFLTITPSKYYQLQYNLKCTLPYFTPTQKRTTPRG